MHVCFFFFLKNHAFKDRHYVQTACSYCEIQAESVLKIILRIIQQLLKTPADPQTEKTIDEDHI